MHIDVYLPLLLPLLAVPAVRWIADRCHPRTATWLLIVTTVLTAAASSLSLTVLAVAEVTGVAEVPTPVGLVACVALAAVVVALCRTGFCQVRTLRDAYDEARLHPDTDLVVTRDDAPVAYALPGAPGRIVVSVGMLDALTPAERQVLLAHERAHLANRHHLFLAGAHVAATANPLLRPLCTTMAYTVERWADEVAADEVADRRLTARSVGKAALATRRAVAAHAAALHVATGPVPRRVSALLTGPSTPRGMAFLVMTFAAAALLALISFAALDAADDLQEVLEVTGIFFFR
jgi:beta-lactamase regulating signal transducer with metallopeptidase domain